MVKSKMAEAIDVANYFLNTSSKETECGELISNLKIQKLVYYAQGFALAILGKPLFCNPIEAWPHGPVVPDLYREFKRYGSDPIEPPTDFDAQNYFVKEEIEVLNEVFYAYGQFSAWKLRNLTHEDATWKNNHLNRGVINHEEMKSYFNTLVEA